MNDHAQKQKEKKERDRLMFRSAHQSGYFPTSMAAMVSVVVFIS